MTEIRIRNKKTVCYLYKSIVYTKGGRATLWIWSHKSVLKELICNHLKLCVIMIESNNFEIVSLKEYKPCDNNAEYRLCQVKDRS